eukprot:m.426485 g.426485  ORF g.426485 m.426485 type:complete len:457 (-) comp20222_c5_seq1:265-1635(-)
MRRTGVSCGLAIDSTPSTASHQKKLPTFWRPKKMETNKPNSIRSENTATERRCRRDNVLAWASSSSFLGSSMSILQAPVFGGWDSEAWSLLALQTPLYLAGGASALWVARMEGEVSCAVGGGESIRARRSGGYPPPPPPPCGDEVTNTCCSAFAPSSPACCVLIASLVVFCLQTLLMKLYVGPIRRLENKLLFLVLKFKPYSADSSWQVKMEESTEELQVKLEAKQQEQTLDAITDLVRVVLHSRRNGTNGISIRWGLVVCLSFALMIAVPTLAWTASLCEAKPAAFDCPVDKCSMGADTTAPGFATLHEPEPTVCFAPEHWRQCLCEVSRAVSLAVALGNALFLKKAFSQILTAWRLLKLYGQAEGPKDAESRNWCLLHAALIHEHVMNVQFPIELTHYLFYLVLEAYKFNKNDLTSDLDAREAVFYLGYLDRLANDSEARERSIASTLALFLAK